MREHLSTTWAHLRRRPYQALAAVGIMVLTFFAISVFVLLAAGSQTILRFFETRPQISAFLKDEVSADEALVLKEELLATGKVETVEYVSQEEALAIYQEQYRDDPLLLEMVSADILPASLEVSAKDLAFLNEIADFLSQEPEVEEVIFQEEVVASLKNWTANIRKVGLGIVSFLGVISFLIVLIIIGMKVALKRREIEIKQLIGASFWDIRLPFLLEGLFYGLIGSFSAWGASYLLLLYLSPFLVAFLKGIPVLPVSPWWMLALLGAEMFLGGLIGLAGSFLAVRRYFKTVKIKRRTLGTAKN